jgi:hypothetical protein
VTFNNDEWKQTKMFQPTKYKWLGSTPFFVMPSHPQIPYLRKEQLLDYLDPPS